MAQGALCQHREVAPVVCQPVQVEQPLVDDVLSGVTLVLEDDWTVVPVQADRVHPPAVPHAGGLVAGHEPDPKSVSMLVSMTRCGECSRASD